MSTGEREPIPTVAEAVTKAAAICDPDSEDAAVRGLIDSFEDDDRPVTVVEDLGGELSSVEQGIDPDEENPAAEMTVAAAIWLSRNPDQEHHHREHVLRESARLYCHGDPPLHVAEWLRELGIS